MVVPNEEIVLFDGLCNLCASSVRFVLEHESGPSLRFAPLQSVAAARLGRQFGFDPARVDTLVLVADGRSFVRSDAVVRLARHLRAPWRWLALARILPRPVRDAAYTLVARNRYRWFGRRATCLLPQPELTSRFLEE